MPKTLTKRRINGVIFTRGPDGIGWDHELGHCRIELRRSTGRIIRDWTWAVLLPGQEFADPDRFGGMPTLEGAARYGIRKAQKPR